MPEVLAALDAFLQEHRRCGEVDGGVEDGRVVTMRYDRYGRNDMSIQGDDAVGERRNGRSCESKATFVRYAQGTTKDFQCMTTSATL